MQSLILLAAVFTLMATYLEATTAEHSASPPISTARVVPAAMPALPTNLQPQKISQSIAKAINATPLNLSIPSLNSAQQQYYSHSKTLVIDLFKADESPKVSYHAELVYDLEKGENITGGKVNVTIPFG